LQVQNGWFFSNKDVTPTDLSLITAQLVDVSNGFSGTGAYYNGQVAFQALNTIDRTTSSSFWVNGSPSSSKRTGEKENREVQFGEDDLTGYTSFNLPIVTDQEYTAEACNNGFCCNITYQVSNLLHYVKVF
jgi:hypothetical protein